MPFDINNPASNEEQKRRLKKSQETSQQQVAAVPDSYRSITTVEAASGHSLPTTGVTYLAGLTPDQKALARYARLMATGYDMTPDQVFGPGATRKTLSTRFGAPLTMKDVQRLSNNFEPVAIARMLNAMETQAAQNAAEMSTHRVNAASPQARRANAVSQAADAVTYNQKRIGQWAVVLSQTQDNLDVSRGMSMAITLSKTQPNLNPKAFYHNWDQVKQWWASTSDRPFDPEAAIAITTSMGNRQANGVTDTNLILFGKKRVAAEAAVDAQNRQIQQQAAYYDYDTNKMVYPDASKSEVSQKADLLVAEAPWTDPLGLAKTTELGPDFYTQVQQIQDAYVQDQEAMSNSPLTKAFQFIGWLGGKQWQYTEQGLVHLGADIMSPVQSATNIVAGKGTSGAERGWQFWQQTKQDGLQRLKQGQSVGDIVEEGYSGTTPFTHWNVQLPGFTSTAFDFGVGWYVDPLVMIGKVAKVMRGIDPIIGGVKTINEAGETEFRASRIFGHDIVVPGRVFPHLDDAFSNTENILMHMPGGKTLVLGRREAIDASLQAGFLKYATKTLPESRVADKLFEAMNKGGTAFMRALDLRTPGQYVERGLDYQYMKLLRDRIMLKFGDGGVIPPSLMADARTAFNEGLTAHFVGYGPKDSIAEWVVGQRTGMSRNSVNEMLASQAENAPADIQNAISEYLAAGGDEGYHLPLTVEGPARSGLYGPRRLFRQAATSDVVTSNPVTRRLGNLRSVNPGRVLGVDEADEYVLLHARRWNTMTETEVRKAQQQVLEAKTRGFWQFEDESGRTMSMGWEAGLKKFVDDLNTEQLDRILTGYNIPKDSQLYNEISDAAFDRVNTLNRRTQTFLAGESGALRTEPLLETQLRNQIYVVDPLEVRRIVRDAVQAPQRAKQMLLKAINDRIYVPELKPLRVEGRTSATLPDVKLGPEDVTPRAPVGDSEGYLYHLSPNEHFGSIANTGVEARPSFYGKAAELVPPEMTKPRMFLADSLERAKQLHHSGGDVVAFRVKADKVGNVIPETSFSGSMYALKGLPASDWEVLTANGQWTPLRYSPELSQAVERSLPTQFGHAVDEFAHNLNQGRIKLWKALTVARPGYIPRVILGDENARFLVTTHSISERLLAQEWFGATGKLSDQGFFNTKIIWKDGSEYSLPAIGAYENNARATGSIRRAEQTTDVLRSAKEDLSALGGESWDPVAAAAREGLDSSVKVIGVPKFVKRWRWALEKQFAKSGPGRVGLESVAAGDTVEQTRNALIQWARDDHFVTLRARLGYQPAEWDSWFNDMADGAHAYTKGNKEIANAALTLDGRDLEAVLNKHALAAPDQLPVIHGASAEALTHGEAYQSGNWLANKMYNTFVSKPEAAWNRNPYYKVWKRRAESAYLQHMKASGIDLTPELKSAMDSASTEFALEQVRGVMFDLTRQSRFTELLQIAFPFPQPFFEGFQTWGSIAVRNPEGIGRMMQLFRTGVESGFIRKDEQTGEYVIPMGAFRWMAAPWAILHGQNPLEAKKRMDQLGVSFVAPLTSFNMLAASSIKFSSNTPLVGKFAGGVPFPVPGMDPLYALGAQQLLKNADSLPAQSYLFQYGPGDAVNLLPNTVKAALGIMPDEQVDSLAASILKSYQVQHLTDENGKPIPPDDLAAMAKHDAQEMLSIRQWAQMLSPGALRTTTAAKPYEAEWQNLLETSDNYDQALKTWLDKHPDLSWIPVGKTFFSDGKIVDPKTGAYIQMPRVSTSEFFGKLWQQPGVGDFIRAHPEIAGLFLLGLDPSVTETQDFTVYSKMLREGFLQYRPLTDIVRSGENLAVSNEIDRWYRTIWDPQMDQLLDGRTTPDYDSAKYKDLKALRVEELSTLAQQHPTWAYYNLEQVGTWDGTNPNFTKGDPMWDWHTGADRPYQMAIDQIRNAIDSTPQTQGLPGFDAMRQVFGVYDKVQKKMDTNGFTDIFQADAVDAGLPHQLAHGLQKVYDTMPDIQPYVEAAFGIRVQDGVLEDAPSLSNLNTPTGQAVANLPDDVRGRIQKFDSGYRRLRTAAQSGYDFDYQRNERYQAASNFQDETYVNHPKLMDTWWNTYYTKNQRAAYKQDLASKPSVFYSAWDWHVLGVDLHKDTVNQLEDIANRRNNIGKKEFDDPEGFSQGDAYKALNADVRGMMKGNAQLATMVGIINDPSWFITHVPGYANQKGVEENKKGIPIKTETNKKGKPTYSAASKAELAWQTIATDISNISKVNANSGLTGVGDFDKGDANFYAGLQKAYGKYVNSWKDYSPVFKEQWDDLQKQLGGSPIQNLLIPDTFFPLGGDA